MTTTCQSTIDAFRRVSATFSSLSLVEDGCVGEFTDGTRLQLQWYGPGIVRVRVTPATITSSRPSLAVIAVPDPEATPPVRAGDDVVQWRNAALTVTLAADGSLSFARGSNTLISDGAGQRRFPANDCTNAEDLLGAATSFAIPAGDAIYGLGQFPDGVMNWRGQQATLIHGNISIAVPMMVGTSGWGLLWDNASHTDVADDADGLHWSSEVADGLDYYIIVADDPAGVIAGYRQLTGVAPLPPRAFLGFIQCKERYQTAAEMTAVVEESRERNLPLDVIVQDWLYWGRGMHRWSCMRHDPESYGDLPAAVQRIHDLHAKVMISIWPRIGQDSALGQELAAKNLLFEGHPDHQDKVYDAFDPEARAIYWRYVKEGLFDLDIDAWWMDGTEPEFEDCHETLRHKASAVRQHDTAAGSWARVLNAYSLATCAGVYEHQRADRDDKRVFILTRSAFLGQQRTGAAVWSGDISATWRTFAQQIPAGLNFCATGQPYWTTDNGGFFVRGRGATFPDGVDDPAFRELFLRWFQFSCFCPLMRSHGTQTPREIWQFGEAGETIYDTLAAFSKLRMRLLPYSYSLAAQTTFAHGSPMQALGFAFPGDPAGHAISDQFMYGPAFMACPVTTPMRHPPTERLVPFAPGDLIDAAGRHGALSMSAGDGHEPVAGSDGRRVIRIDETWAGNRPAQTTDDRYWVRFAGHLRIDADTAPLLARVAGGMRLLINGACVIDDATDGPLREHHVDLSRWAGERVALIVDYLHIDGDAVIQVGWQQEVLTDTATATWERSVYLPPGSWYDFFTGAQHDGGQTITMAAPLEQMPVLVRAGSIVPLGPVQQWHDEQADAAWEIRIHPGTDGQFTIYEDAGDGYAYEDGACSHFDLHWDDAARRLSIGDRHGSFTGQCQSRRFDIVVVDADHGCGIAAAKRIDATMTYTGEACAINLP